MGAMISEQVAEVVQAGRLAHLVTLNPDGSPQVSAVWVGIDGDQIVSGHMGAWRKVQNLQRDPRVALSIEAEGRDERGLDHYLVVHGRPRWSKAEPPRSSSAWPPSTWGPGSRSRRSTIRSWATWSGSHRSGSVASARGPADAGLRRWFRRRRPRRTRRPQVLGQLGQRGAGVETAGRGHHVGRATADGDRLQAGHRLAGRRPSAIRRAPRSTPRPVATTRPVARPGRTPHRYSSAVTSAAVRVGRLTKSVIPTPWPTRASIGSRSCPDDAGGQGRRPESVAGAGVADPGVGREGRGVDPADQEAHARGDRVGQRAGPDRPEPHLVPGHGDRVGLDLEPGPDDLVGQAGRRPSGEEAPPDGVPGEGVPSYSPSRTCSSNGAPTLSDRCRSHRARGRRWRGTWRWVIHDHAPPIEWRAKGRCSTSARTYRAPGTWVRHSSSITAEASRAMAGVPRWGR